MPPALFDELAAEILHHYARGRHIVAVDSADRVLATEAADALAVGLRARGAHVERAHGGAMSIVDSLVRPFRAGTGDALLVVDGAVLGTPDAEALAWSLWVDADGPGIGGPSTRTSADAIIDLSDRKRPVRRFSDWCVIPRR